MFPDCSAILKSIENRQWKTVKCFSNLVDLVPPLFACFSQIRAYLIYFRVIHYIFSLICESQRVQRLIVTRSRWWNSSEHNCSTVSTKTIFQYPGQRLQQKEKKSITDLRHFYTTTIPDSSYAHTKTIPNRTVVHTQETVILVCFANLRLRVNGCSGRSGSKWVGARTETHWTGSKYSKVRIEIKCTKLSTPSAPYDVWCVCTTCFTSVPLPFVLYRIALHVGTNNYPA